MAATSAKWTAAQWIGWMLTTYLLVIGVTASGSLVASFDPLPPTSPAPLVAAGAAATPLPGHVYGVVGLLRTDNGRLLAQAFLAGIVGSFLHAAQSLTSYIGNGEFKRSWTAWYVMRPWIGGILALTLAFAARTGFVPVNGTPDPFGIVALGLLGGWFSKTTTDKLQETFSTLLKTDADKERKNKLGDARQTLTRAEPNPVPSTTMALTLFGSGFVDGATVTIDTTTVAATFVSATELTVDLTALSPRPTGDTPVVVTNPGNQQDSEPLAVVFQ